MPRDLARSSFSSFLVLSVKQGKHLTSTLGLGCMEMSEF